jgi:hypothetical protein
LAEERTEDGRRIVPLEPSSTVDPCSHLPDEERQPSVREEATHEEPARNPLPLNGLRKLAEEAAAPKRWKLLDNDR